jgi:hypothetical protein
MGPCHAGGLDCPADREGDRPVGTPSLPTPQARQGEPAGVAIYALCRDPETHALYLVPAPRVLSWPDIDGRRRGALLPGLRWDQSRRRTELARGAESTHTEPGRARPQRDRPWRANSAAHGRLQIRTRRADEVRPSRENHSTPAPARSGRSAAIVGLIIVLAAWLLMIAVLVWADLRLRHTSKSPGWGTISRRAGQDGPSGAAQITGMQCSPGTVMVTAAPAGKTPPAGTYSHAVPQRLLGLVAPAMTRGGADGQLARLITWRSSVRVRPPGLLRWEAEARTNAKARVPSIVCTRSHYLMPGTLA